ncbi:MAG TPA: MgtC/SapB family protein [Micromonosporaceae bacterium]|nr:MgtC/SapB family protein [Micromonosporaceae bacterium]
MVIGGVDVVIPVQILVSAGLGAAIGLERELSAQAAGLRTHMLVCLGAAVFTLTGAITLHTDPTRIAAQVVTGIGFLGAGAILREGATVRGLTTAASLWLTAAIGVAVGLRSWNAAWLSTVVGLGILLLVKVFERDALPRRRMLEITLTVDPEAHIDSVVNRASAILPKSRVIGVAYVNSLQTVTIVSRAEHRRAITEIATELRALGGVRGVAVSR